MLNFTDLPAVAADVLSNSVWEVDAFEHAADSSDLLAALVTYETVPGSSAIVHQLARRQSDAPWTPAGRSTFRARLAALRALPVTPEALAALFGPQWESIVEIVQRAATLTRADELAFRRDRPLPPASSIARAVATAEIHSAYDRYERSGHMAAARRAITHAVTNSEAGMVACIIADDAVRGTVVEDLLLDSCAGMDAHTMLTYNWITLTSPTARPDETNGRER